MKLMQNIGKHLGLYEDGFFWNVALYNLVEAD
jgi:hypothetical protein